MEIHECSQTVNLKRIEKMLFGNGQPGLIKDVESLKNNYGDMKDDLNNISTSIAALAKSQLEQDVITKMKEKRSEQWGKSLERAAYAFSIAAILVTWMVMFGEG